MFSDAACNTMMINGVGFMAGNIIGILIGFFLYEKFNKD